MAHTDTWFGSRNGNGLIKRTVDGTWSSVFPLSGSGDATKAYCIAIDSFNVVWVGTFNGIQTVNGTTGEVIKAYGIADGLTNTYINCISIDTNNNKWIGTKGGLFKYDDLTWTNYSTISGMASDYVKDVAIDTTGMIWAATTSGISTISGNNINVISGVMADDDVTCIVIDNQNTKWIGTAKGLSSSPTGVTWTNYTYGNGYLPYDIFENYIYSLVVDSSGVVWAADGGIGFVRTDTWVWKHYGSTAKMSLNMGIDSTGKIWGGYANGATVYDGLTWTEYNSVLPPSVSSNYIYIGHRQNQLFSPEFPPATWPPKTFKATIPTRNIIPSSPSVVKILQGTHKGVNIDAQGHGYLIDVWDDLPIDNQGIKWFGTDAGLQRFDGSSGTNYTTAPNGIQSNNVLSIAISGTDKWIGTDKGVQVLDVSGCFTNYNLKDYVTSDLKTTIDSFFKSGINSITIDALGNKWFGSNNGLMQLTPEIMKSVYISGASVISGTNAISGTLITTDNGLLSNIINSVAIETAGTAWIGTNEGLFKYDGYSLTSYTTASTSAIGGLFGDTIYSIAIDTSNNKWIGTDIGVYKFDGINWKSYLTTESVKAIGIDGQGFKWFAVAGGVYKFDGYSFVYYNTFSSRDTSLVGRSLRGAVSFSNYVSSLAIYKPSRIVWFGTNIGIQKYSGILPTTKFNTSNRLISNNIKAIAIEANPPAPKKVLATIPAERLPVFVTW